MKIIILAATLAALSAMPAFGQDNPITRRNNDAGSQNIRGARPVPMPDFDKMMVKKPMSDMDAMMVKNCKQMPAAQMMADAECKDYLKNHPDWMKGK
jgi:hypothetical protein